jgi:hypothetical protein
MPRCPIHPKVKMLRVFKTKFWFCPACSGSHTSERKRASSRANALLGGMPMTRKRCACGRRLAITNRSGVCRLCQRQPSTAPKAAKTKRRAASYKERISNGLPLTISLDIPNSRDYLYYSISKRQPTAGENKK